MRPRSSDRARRSVSEWREVFRRFERSGLSIADFCRRESVSPSSFHRWRSKAAPETEPFVELAVPAAAVPDSQDWVVELELPGHIVLRVRRA